MGRRLGRHLEWTYADAMSDRFEGAAGLSDRFEEHAALLALIRGLGKGTKWSSVTEQVLDAGSACRVWEGQESETLVADPARNALLSEARRDLEVWAAKGWRFLGVLDDYPSRIREIHQAPPFLFAAGSVRAEDPAIAVVGSRKASSHGRHIAASVAAALVDHGITVLSGLAEGIDSAAHRAALQSGGRTVAVIGTGLARSYPVANKILQREVSDAGLVLSQFWPDGPPQPHNFLMRNAVMSGYGRATLVVEAGEQSGTRAQARMAVEHGRAVILTDQVAQGNEWAKRLIGRPSVYVASSADEVMGYVEQALKVEDTVFDLLGDLVGSAL
jgi:DNA processing protein